MASRTKKTAPAAETPDSATIETGADSAPASPKGKLGDLVALLSRPEGARIEDLSKATGWQAHSVRGAMSGSLKKKLGLTITSEKAETGRVYCIVKGAGA